MDLYFYLFSWLYLVACATSLIRDRTWSPMFSLNHWASREVLPRVSEDAWDRRLCVLGCSVVSDSLWPRGLQPARLLCPWDSPGKNTGVGCHFLLQEIFWTQGSNPGLLHCRWILYLLNQKVKPGKAEWRFLPSQGFEETSIRFHCLQDHCGLPGTQTQLEHLEGCYVGAAGKQKGIKSCQNPISAVV